MLRTIQLLGVTITSETKEKVLEYVLDAMQKGTKKLFITTPNPEILVRAHSHLDYHALLNDSEVALPDGVGLQIGGWLMGRPVKERITGVDFIEMLCKASSEKPMSMGFLGGRGGVAERAAHRLVSKYPWLNVVFVAEEWSEAGFENGKVFSMKYLVSSKNEKIPNTKYQIPDTIDILFVAFGAPKQEEWIYENLPKLPVKAAMGVGGAFDYLSGDVTRAPIFVRKIGLEWLFRLFVQPWRWKRQLALIQFIWLVLQERVRG